MSRFQAGFLAALMVCFTAVAASGADLTANAAKPASATPPATATNPATPAAPAKPTTSPSSGPAEDWKGASPATEFTFGVHTGLAIIDDQAGFAVLGSAAKKILNRGFVPDINDQLFAEIQLGPVFVQNSTAFFSSMHLRWDFYLDEDWSFFALGGLGITTTGSGFLRGGAQTQIYPRFGIGAVWSFADVLAARFELSHEFIGVGLIFSL